ncbi:MAG: hypothetical protein FWD17_12860, partial [Polyangiaceae bacterium]|nr:hypothetical protein [Polyangiaceae bacterium]
PDALRAAIAEEMGVPVVAGTQAPGGTVHVSQEAGRSVVSFETPAGRREARVIDLPVDPDEAARDVALVAVNLARDQAAAFIHPEPEPASAPPAEHHAEARAPRAAVAAAEPPACGRPGPFAPIGFDVVPVPRRRHISIGVVGTLSSGIDGVAAAPVLNIDRWFVCGAELAGVVNVANGPVSGVQAAGAVNAATGPLSGLQAAGLINVARRGLSGVQAAGNVNVTSGPLDGLQAAGLVNYASETHGWQVGGAANVTGSLSGAQIAGVFNVATGIAGAQIAPINIAAGEVHGVQVGVINVSERADFALGVINVATRGRFHADAWALPESGLLLAGVKNGGPHYHYIYGVGLRPTDPHRAWGALGIGAHITPLESIFVDVDAIGHEEIANSVARNELYEARAVVGYRAARGVSVFAGPTYNVLESRNGAPTGVAPGYATTLARTRSEQFRGWVGAAFGVEGF